MMDGFEQEDRYTRIEKTSKALLDNFQIDFTNDNFQETPRRFASWLEEYIEPNYEFLAGMHLKKQFKTESEDMICKGPHIVKMLCPHHLLPIIMKVWLVYIPDWDGKDKENRKVVGLSKIPRFLRALAKYPQMQEDYTHKAQKIFMKEVKAHACLIYSEGVHTCEYFRGANEHESILKISSPSPRFRDDRELEMRALNLINKDGWRIG